jgi:hypothetical protein
MLNINSVSFDLSDCKLVEESESHRMWVNAADIYHSLRVSQHRPSWTFDLRDCSAASDFYSRQCADNKGVMLAMEVVQIGQFNALKGVFKYRSPIPNSLAMMFVHIIWIPFQRGMIQLNIESLEVGTTGMREATVMLIEGDRWPKLSSTDEPIEVSGTVEMFDQMLARPLLALPSDEEQYDKSFPDHPLSKVRHRMTEVMSSFTVSAQPSDLVPFRTRFRRGDPASGF